MNKLLTIGQLAKKAGMRTSALRYYEEQGLLSPIQRSESGYRLYAPQAQETLHFIQRAQQIGFSLADIRTLLTNWQGGNLDENTVLSIAQQRYFELERQMTQSLVLQHELGLFLQDLRDRSSQNTPIENPLDQFLNRVCNNPLSQPNADSFEWLLAHSGCALNSPQGRRLLEPLRGKHMHVWQQGEHYHLLIVSQDAAVGEALAELATLEADCHLHAHHQNAPQFAHNDEGFLLVVQGENAFIYVRLFLMLEEMD